MRFERLGEKAVILRDLPCPAFELARMLNGPNGVMVSESGPLVGPDQSALSREVEPPHPSVIDKRVRSFDSQEAVGKTKNLRWLAQDDAAFFVEAVASYETVCLYFSETVESPDGLISIITTVIANLNESGSTEPKLIELPVCYELGPDLKSAALALQMPTEDLIKLHIQADYRCYAVGFSPGFAYLGYLDDRISTLPRLASPRPRVESGSVGITGRQTAVYPSATPGGWNLIGKCPLKLVDVEDGYFPIEAGDRVRFKRISEAEFARLEGERL